MKTCRKCKIDKPFTEFVKDKKKPDGFYSSCKTCNNNRIKKWHEENGEKFAEYQAQWGKANRKSVTDQQRRWRERQSKEYKLARSISYRIKVVIKGAKSESVLRALGCSVEELIKHLESKFQPGMTWQNHTRDGWHIDHIKPLCTFDLSDPEQFAKACHYTNLQPLWAKENAAKSGRYIEPDQCIINNDLEG
jgi:hypothetical protein